MLSKKYIEAMKIGYTLNLICDEHEEIRDEIWEWTDSEQIAELAENIIADENKFENIENPESEKAKITVLEEINVIRNSRVRDHGYDDINRGVIAGQIFGKEKDFNEEEIEIIEKAILAECLWNDMRFHYYQEVCSYINKRK